jgi:hypothetical protein
MGWVPVADRQRAHKFALCRHSFGSKGVCSARKMAESRKSGWRHP